MKLPSAYALPFLRVGLALVFLYFGFQQVYSPDAWTGLVPSYLTSVVLTSANLVVFSGIMELTLGLFLLLGLYTRFASLILGVHLAGITFAMGFTPIGVRDFGLTIATLVLFLVGPHAPSIDTWIARKREKDSSKKSNL